jgi:hypothetical protein
MMYFQIGYLEVVIGGGGENFEDFDFSTSPLFAGSATATSLIESKLF